MRKNETIFPHNTFTYLNPTQNNFSISNFPQIEKNTKQKDSEDFIVSLQKGYKDIRMMYRNSLSKPYVSFQCNYYCNLNACNNNDESINHNQNTNINNSIQCLDLMINNIREEHNITN